MVIFKWIDSHLALTLEGINDIHRSDCLAAGMFSVSDRVADNILEEDLYMYS